MDSLSTVTMRWEQRQYYVTICVFRQKLQWSHQSSLNVEVYLQNPTPGSLSYTLGRQKQCK